MKKRMIDFLSETFIFRGINFEKIRSITQQINIEIQSFKKGDIIYSPELFENKIGFVFTGECYVERLKSDGNSIQLNSLKPHDSFGIIAVISEKASFPTRIRAKKCSSVLFIHKNDFLRIIKRYPTVSVNVIHFLADKLDFLNKKVASFSFDTAEEKIANYILLSAPNNESNYISFNSSKAAATLNIGRASVYRVLETMEKNSLIKYENKKIYILNRKGLERISK